MGFLIAMLLIPIFFVFVSPSLGIVIFLITCVVFVIQVWLTKVYRRRLHQGLADIVDSRNQMLAGRGVHFRLCQDVVATRRSRAQQYWVSQFLLECSNLDSCKDN